LLPGGARILLLGRRRGCLLRTAHAGVLPLCRGRDKLWGKRWHPGALHTRTDEGSRERCLRLLLRHARHCLLLLWGRGRHYAGRGKPCCPVSLIVHLSGRLLLLRPVSWRSVIPIPVLAGQRLLPPVILRLELLSPSPLQPQIGFPLVTSSLLGRDPALSVADVPPRALLRPVPLCLAHPASPLPPKLLPRTLRGSVDGLDPFERDSFDIHTNDVGALEKRVSQEVLLTLASHQDIAYHFAGVEINGVASVLKGARRQRCDRRQRRLSGGLRNSRRSGLTHLRHRCRPGGRSRSDARGRAGRRDTIRRQPGNGLRRSDGSQGYRSFEGKGLLAEGRP